jgi:hypothetical protein
MLQSVFGPLARLLRHYHLSSTPPRGSAADIADRLRTLTDLAGVERLPPRTDPARLAGWLAELNEFAAPPARHRPHRLLLFCLMPDWMNFCTPIAVALAGRGCAVDFVWLPYRHMDQPEPGETPAGPPPRSLPARLLPWVSLHPRLRFCNLLDVRPSTVTPALRTLADKYARVDVCYATYRELVDVEADEQGRSLLAFRCMRNLKGLARLETVLRRRRYDSALIPNGGIYEFGAGYELTRAHGLPCVTFDFGERKKAIVASGGSPCTEWDTRALWRADEPHVLTPERGRRVAELLERRERPNWKAGEYNWPGQLATVRPDDELRAAVGLSADRPVALLCTNIAWDTAVIGRTRAFPSMAEWIVRTVDWFAGRPDWQLVVRVHPAESYLPTNAPIADLLARHFRQLPPHVRVVKPADPVNTYGLMRLISLGLVYSTTTGLEMACRGLPVVVAGRVHYSDKGFTTDPNSPDDYFAALERATAAVPERLQPRQVELARCYADVYFECFPRPFPWWDIGYLNTFMDEWPMRRILAGDCPPEFLSTFDFLAGRVAA